MTKGLFCATFALCFSSLTLSFACTGTLGADDALGGAGDTAGSGGKMTGSGGTGDAGAPPVLSPEVQRCNTLYETFEPEDDPTYEDDILPIFRTSCNVSICHGGEPESAQADLWLGRLDTEEMSEDEIAYTYDALLDIQSRSIPDLALLRKDRPRDSLLMLKLDDCFEHPELECVLEDPGLPPCGDPMPVLMDPLSEETKTLIRSWIANGAKR